MMTSPLLSSVLLTTSAGPHVVQPTHTLVPRRRLQYPNRVMPPAVNTLASSTPTTVVDDAQTFCILATITGKLCHVQSHRAIAATSA